jgi:hypothetical protein
MCERQTKCRKPEKLKGRPEDCSAEQIKNCHGSPKDHPCLPGKKTK